MMEENQNIDHLLTGYLNGELNDSDTHIVSEWIASSEKNQKCFEDFARIWNLSQNTNIPEFSSEKAWKKIAPQIHKTPFYKQFWLQIAASILILIGSMTAIFQLTSDNGQTSVYASTEILNDTLQDGSVITLNKNTQISYAENFNSKTREVKLEGEAFFNIERDTTRPFIIHLEQSEVHVLGTSFNIKSSSEDELISVYVKSGVVMFKYQSQDSGSTYLSIKLHAGDKVVYNKTTQKLERIQEASEKATEMYWLNQELIFDGIELGKVSRILESVYDVEISFTDEHTPKCLLTVDFENSNIDHIMAVIATTFELELEQSDNHYTLKGTSCAPN